MSNYLIKQLTKSIAAGKIKETLKKLLMLSEGGELFDQVILVNSRYNQVEADNRTGILDYGQYTRERAKLSNSILSLVRDIEEDQELMSLLRRRQKEVLYAEYIKISVDFSEFTAEKSKQYRANQFLNIDDFLNELFFEISEFVPPGSFRRNWILKRQTEHLKDLATADVSFYAPLDFFRDSPDGLSDDEISAIINRVYPLGERIYDDDELKEIYALNDEVIKVCRI